MLIHRHLKRDPGVRVCVRMCVLIPKGLLVASAGVAKAHALLRRLESVWQGDESAGAGHDSR